MDTRALAEETAVDDTRPPASAATQCLSIRRAVGVFWVLAAVLVDVALSEVVALHSGSYKAPYTTVYLNHVSTGLGCSLAAVFVLAKRKQRFRQLLADAGWHTGRDIVLGVALLAVIWQSYNCFWAAGISMTSVATFNAISTSRTVFIFFFSCCWLREQATFMKCLAVSVCVGGCIVVTMSTADDEQEVSNNMGGIACALAFSVGEAVLSVLWGRWFGGNNDDWALSLVIIGIMGVANTLLCWPALPVLGAIGWELNPLPTPQQWLYLAESAAFAVADNFTFFVAIALSSPLFVSVGMVLKIPFGALADWWIRGEIIGSIPLIGMAAISIGFLLMVSQKDSDATLEVTSESKL